MKIENGVLLEVSNDALNPDGSFSFPPGVTSIGNLAFYNCTNLRKVIIPDGVTSIGDSAFGDCRNLCEIMIPDSVTSIGNHTFYDCSNLPAIMIPDSVTSIGEFAFHNCSNLHEIIIPAALSNIDDGTFSECGKLSKIIISAGVRGIGFNVFHNCSNLHTLVIDAESREDYEAIKGLLPKELQEKVASYHSNETKKLFESNLSFFNWTNKPFNWPTKSYEKVAGYTTVFEHPVLEEQVFQALKEPESMLEWLPVDNQKKLIEDINTITIGN